MSAEQIAIAGVRAMMVEHAAQRGETQLAARVGGANNWQELREAMQAFGDPEFRDRWANILDDRETHFAALSEAREANAERTLDAIRQILSYSI